MDVQLMLKVPRLLEEMYGIKFPVSKCASHLASGSIRCLCTSVTHSQQNAVNLYENLRALLQHSTHSSKSMEILDEACDILELNNVHILNWGSKKMAGFLDACVQSSHIIAPFLDTFVNWKIWEDETKFIVSPQDVLLLQLFADLYPVFVNRYLHWVDSDEVLICEVHRDACETANVPLDKNISTPLADALYDSLKEDQHCNIIADFDIKGTKHTITLNTKVTEAMISLL